VSTDDPTVAGMAGRYAAALFEMAKDQRQIETVRRASRPSRPCWADEDLRRLVRAPVISADDQMCAPAAARPRPGISGLTSNFQADRPQPAPFAADILRTFARRWRASGAR
jgi:F-type H+-transporting ATPase subunit delta